MKRWVAGLIVVALAAILVPVALVRAAVPATVYFSPTGHHLGAPFLNYWRTNGGLAVYGYPISEAFTETSTTDGKPYTVQYFERARFEYHPENKPPYDILLGQLGRAMAERLVNHPALIAVPASSIPANNPEFAYFPQTGHSLRMGFLAYWQANGGLEQFGYPISEEFPEKSPADGEVYTVQYFERARFEWHPENKEPYKVLLGLLGNQIAKERKVNTAAVTRQAGVPDYDPSLFFTPTPIPTATPTATATPLPTATPTPQPKTGEPRPDLGGQYIEVNLSMQHLWAWENGEVVFDVPISSGKPGWETPTGTFYVNQMLETQDMTGGTAGSDEYYYTPDVPWIMYFDWNGDAIHGVYWHNNFGIRPSSHGCVGAPIWAAKWLYDWGYIGLPVWIHY